jgi:putative DNA primase/helicase
MLKEFKSLCKKCPRLKTLYEKQEKEVLDKGKWQLVIRLLVNAGRIALAREFSRLSKKHDYESEEYIDELSMQRPTPDVLCTELGCKEADITGKNKGKPCFKELLQNLEKEIVNSPTSKVAYDIEEKERMGWEYGRDEEGELTDKFSINHNIYAKYIFENYKLLIQENGNYYLYRNNYWIPISDMKLERVLRFFFHKIEPDRWNTSIANQYMSVLRNECWDMDDVKLAENCINVKNGLLNIDTFELEPHNNRIFTTNQRPVVYDAKKEHDPEKDCPAFLKFLSSVFDDHNKQTKKKLIKFIQEIMGYCLSNSVKAHKFFILLGDGSNGKSVFCDVLTELAGGVHNVSNVALRNFGKQFALAQIMDKTLNISTENEIEGTLDTQTIKAIVSGEVMQMEEKFKMPISHRPTTKLIFAVNTMPKTTDKSFGFGRRVICVPFNIRFVTDEPENEMEREADFELTEKLMEELEGIFAFAIAGLQRLKNRDYKFKIPKAVRKATKEYEAANDPDLAFVQECIEADKKAYSQVNQRMLYDVFLEWCAQEGYTEERNAASTTKKFMTKFRKALKKARIPVKEETHSGDIYPISGIKLSEEGQELWDKLEKDRRVKRSRS